jgi:asparagine synthetase B (glutamine-hydrolysing)
MPFVYLLPKRGTVGANELRLGELLCPYRGGLARHDVAGGTLWHTTLGAATDGGLELPAGTRRPPNSAWLVARAHGDGLRFETDPLGTFPLWVAETADWLAVTGEVKALGALPDFDVGFEPERWPADRKRPPDYSPYANVRRVMPGAALHVARDGTWRADGGVPLVYAPSSTLTDPAEQAQALDAAMLASARVMAGAGGTGDEWAAFLSGGIDSSSAVALLARDVPQLRTYTLGTEHGDEYAEAGALAAHLGLPHTRVFATTEQARAHFDRAVRENETVDGLTGETLAQLGLLAQTAAAGGARRVVTGYGADLLFGSMLRHELYMKVTGVDDLQSLIERTMWSGEFAPFYAWSLGVEVHHLFWDPAVMNAAFRIPPDHSFDGTHEKIVMRRMMVERGHLLADHAFRKKQALTDGTQFNRVLSAALGLPDKHAYGGKNDAAVAVLRRTFAESAV